MLLSEIFGKRKGEMMRRFGSLGMGGISASILVVGVFLVGCSKADSSAESPIGHEGKHLQRPSPSVVSGPEGSALMAYRAMWRDLTAASLTSNAASPSLDDHARDGALELMKFGLKKAKKEKLVSKGAPLVDPEVVSAIGSEVKLRDCVDDRHWLQYKLGGELKNNLPGGHFRTDATVRRVGGVWKVSYLYMHEVGSC
ncbi:hypothetical protein [Streptomyces sp. NEAU-YJ-81]|uniref:hypothetical protein n=1 Tax=Streptomyces sp. NEAU-YJ-81 TaxID=2820288 RepID=UPI001FBB31EF|nr:hypothetical protein [Streptomyces sp. NEAU-YJ-81]